MFKNFERKKSEKNFRKLNGSQTSSNVSPLVEKDLNNIKESAGIKESNVRQEPKLIKESNVRKKQKVVNDSINNKAVKNPFELKRMDRFQDYTDDLQSEYSGSHLKTIFDGIFQKIFPTITPEFAKRTSLMQILLHGDTFLIKLVDNYYDHLHSLLLKTKTANENTEKSKEMHDLQTTNYALLLRLQKTRTKLLVGGVLIATAQVDYSSITERYNKILAASLTESIEIDFPIEGTQYYNVPSLLKTIAKKLSTITVEISMLLPKIIWSHGLHYDSPFHNHQLIQAWNNIAIPFSREVESDMYYVLRLLPMGRTPDIMPVEFHKQWGMYHDEVTDLLKFLVVGEGPNLQELTNSVKYKGNHINKTVADFFSKGPGSMSKNTFERLIYVMELLVPKLYQFVMTYTLNRMNISHTELWTRLLKLLSPSIKPELFPLMTLQETQAQQETQETEPMHTGNSIPEETEETDIQVKPPVEPQNLFTDQEHEFSWLTSVPKKKDPLLEKEDSLAVVKKV